MVGLALTATILPLSLLCGLGLGVFYIIEDYSFSNNVYNSTQYSNYNTNESSNVYQEYDETTESTDITDMS